MLACNSLLALLLRNLIRFARNQGYEFNAAFNEKITCVFAESETGRGGQNLRDYLLNSSYISKAIVS